MCSLLERFTDCNSPPNNRNSIAIELIKREIMFILSSRPVLSVGDSIHPDLEKSVLNYGVVSSFEQGSRLEERCNIVAERMFTALSIFEPRISNISVIIKKYTESGCILELCAEYKGTDFNTEILWDSILFKFSYVDEDNIHVN